jgi:hypothetical protein
LVNAAVPPFCAVNCRSLATNFSGSYFSHPKADLFLLAVSSPGLNWQRPVRLAKCEERP